MKLGLGTVEFAAKTGKHATSVSLDEAARILDIAQRSGIVLLDTAAQAGNSEEVLGECLLKNHPFKIVAKAPHFAGEMIIAHHADQLEMALHQSLQNLKQERIYALMTGFEDGLFLNQGEKLYKRMENLKAQGLMEKIGISVSGARQIEHMLASYQPDIVQLPLNVLDERLLKSGHLQRLKQHGIEIHVRDVFLQGVLLDPTHLHPWFWPIKKLMDSYHQYLIEEGLTPLEGALNFVLGLPEVDYALVGVSSAEQLREVIGAVLPDVQPASFIRFACSDEKFINPLKWNLYE
jgi:aryl-alcohol dehydrogenase-like predicted oxidoreductase